MRRSLFREIAKQAISELLESILEKMENVAITIEDWPGTEHLAAFGRGTNRYNLLGLYVGIPLTQRTSGYNFVLPDRIFLFQKNIEARTGTVEELERLVKDTVAHEVAHHFGMNDAELKRLGL